MTKRLISLALSLVLTLSLLLGGVAVAETAPNLIAANDWAREHIQEAYDNGWLIPELQSDYKNAINRKEFVYLAMSWLRYHTGLTDAQLVEKYAVEPDRTFSDAGSDMVILAAGKLDITAGAGGGAFGPGATFSRQDAAVMLVKVYNILNQTGGGFNTADPPNHGWNDLADASEYARSAINFVGVNGVMSGSGGNFNPKETFSREQSITVFNQIDQETKDEKEPIKEIVLDEGKETYETIGVNEAVKLSVVFKPENATNKNVTWATGDERVAIVSKGIVKGVGEGEVRITATSEDGNKTAGCTITVIYIPVDDMAFPYSQKTETVEVGGSVTLKPNISPSNASNKNIIWTSSNPSVATVAHNGAVKGIKAGKVSITGTTECGKKQDVCEVTVTFVKVEGIRIDQSKQYEVEVGKTIRISPVFTPSKPTNTNVTWTSSNTAIATVSGGTVRGVRAGAVTITATTEDGGFKASAAVTVFDSIRVESVTLDKTELHMDAGEDNTVTLKATIYPSNAANKKVTWSSSDTTVATVNPSGKVEGHKNGTATVTATTEDGGKTASCAVQVTFVPIVNFYLDYPDPYNSRAKIEILENSTVTLGIGNKLSVTGWVDPANASNKYARWTIDNSTIAEMKVPSGKRTIVFTGLREGTVKVTATTLDGGFTRAFFIKVVYIPVESIDMTQAGQTVKVDRGKTVSIKAKALPDECTDKDLIWESSNPAVATVSNRGVVTGVSAGTVTITVWSKDRKKSASCKVEVIYIPVEGIEVK